ncbi:MAG: hypothetical protein AAFY46_03055, partial [Planctomycetota bacterium]
VIAALLATGCDVVPIGVAMTPTLAVAVDTTSLCGGGIMVTASHNPAEWNGLKVLIPGEPNPHDATTDPDGNWSRWYGTERAAAPEVELAKQIIHEFREGRFPYQDSIRCGRVEPYRSDLHDDATDAHRWSVAMAVDSVLRHEYEDRDHPRALKYVARMDSHILKWRVVLDSVNASGGPAAEKLIRSFYADAIQLHGDNSGIFPHTPEPTAENLSGEGGLCDAVPGLKADVGFAQDPDGDRLAIVDETGRYIGEEYTLALCAVSILEAHKAAPQRAGELSPKVTEGARDAESPSASLRSAPPAHAGEGTDIVVCANLSTSRMIDDIAARYGASVVRTAVGEANVVEAMKRLKREGKTVLLGGEGNGGVIWPEVTYVRDSLGSMALVLSLMARTGKTVSELVADIPSYAIVKRKQPLAKKEDAKPAIERIAAAYATERVDTQDGVRVDFDAKRAWVHVRASNTEPILRLIAEAEDEAVANEILDDVAKLVEG